MKEKKKEKEKRKYRNRQRNGEEKTHYIKGTGGGGGLGSFLYETALWVSISKYGKKKSFIYFYMKEMKKYM